MADEEKVMLRSARMMWKGEEERSEVKEKRKKEGPWRLNIRRGDGKERGEEAAFEGEGERTKCEEEKKRKTEMTRGLNRRQREREGRAPLRHGNHGKGAPLLLARQGLAVPRLTYPSHRTMSRCCNADGLGVHRQTVHVYFAGLGQLYRCDQEERRKEKYKGKDFV
jgi:hypothetical protein